MGKFDSYYDPPDYDFPCDICGYYVDDCVCPECPKCGEVGGENCYLEPDDVNCGGLWQVEKTAEQQIGKLQYKLALAEEALHECQNFNSLYVDQIKCLQHCAKTNPGYSCPGPLTWCDETLPCWTDCPK